MGPQPQRQQVSFPFTLYPAAKEEKLTRVEKFGESFQVLIRRFSGAKGARVEGPPITGTFTIAQAEELRDRVKGQLDAIQAVIDDMKATLDPK